MTELAQARPVSFVLTADRVKSCRFYAEVLGLPVIADDPFALTFALGGETTLRLTELPGHRPSGHPVLGWTVPDIRAAMTRLKGAGLTFAFFEGFGQDEEGIWTAPDGSAQVAWFTDPDGNVLSLGEFACG